MIILQRNETLQKETFVLSLVQAAGWPIWPLMLCSILVLAVIIERLIQLQTRKVIPPICSATPWRAPGRPPPMRS